MFLLSIQLKTFLALCFFHTTLSKKSFVILPLPVTYHPLRALKFHFLIASNCLFFLTVLPSETLTLTLTKERRGEIKNKDAYLQFTGNLNHKRKNTNPKDYIITKNYCQSSSAHNNQRTAKPEEPLHMQLFKKKSESVSVLNMTTQNGNVARLPEVTAILIKEKVGNAFKSQACSLRALSQTITSLAGCSAPQPELPLSPPPQPGFGTW